MVTSVPLKSFILHWKDGSCETIKGNTIAHAFNNAGYGGGAIAALDYYEETDSNKEDI